MCICKTICDNNPMVKESRDALCNPVLNPHKSVTSLDALKNTVKLKLKSMQPNVTSYLHVKHF